MLPFPKEALVCRSRAGGNPRTRTACAYVFQALTPGLQSLYCLRSRTNRLQFRRGLLLWLCAVVRVASGSAPLCAVPPVRWGALSPPFAKCLGGLRYAHQSSSFHLSCPDRHRHACCQFSVHGSRSGLPTGLFRRSHHREPHDERERFPLSDRSFGPEGGPRCRSSLGQSPRAAVSYTHLTLPTIYSV